VLVFLECLVVFPDKIGIDTGPEFGPLPVLEAFQGSDRKNLHSVIAAVETMRVRCIGLCLGEGADGV
jgi:hypothetical protein